jgi:hypothetical protein
MERGGRSMARALSACSRATNMSFAQGDLQHGRVLVTGRVAGNAVMVVGLILR